MMKTILKLIGMFLACFVLLLLLYVPVWITTEVECSRLDAWEESLSEKADIPAYQHYSKLIINSKEWSMGTLLEENGIDGSFQEALAMNDDHVWFVYTYQEEDTKEKVWNIAALDLETGQINTLYTEVFGDHYRVITDGLKNKSAFYHNGKIVLTDHEKLTEYDIQTGSIRNMPESEYDYPDFSWNAEITDHKTIRITNDTKERVIKPESLAQSSEAFSAILESGDRKIWNGEVSSQYLFDSVQTDGENCYIFCRLMNWHGESYAIVFEYHMDSEKLQYCFYRYTSERFHNNLFVIPRIGQ